MDKDAIKYREMYNAALQWVFLNSNGGSIAHYLKKKGIYTVAIYGMSDMGNCLYKELSNSGISVIYAIDQGFPKLYYDIECYRLSEVENMEKPDVVIVTLPHLYDKIVIDVKKFFNCSIISITELVYDAMYSD